MLESLESSGAYAIIVSDVLEIILFGIYTIFYTFAIIILTVSKKPLPIDWSMVTAMTVLFITCMAHTSMLTTDRHTTFTSGLPFIPSGVELSGILRTTDVLFKTSCFFSELMMIHRCWAVWDYRASVVVVPLIMAASGMICALIGPTLIPTSEFVSPFVAPRLLAYDIAFCVLSLFVYILTTALIIVHLRRVSALLRNVKSMDALVWSLAGACIEAGGFLVLAHISVVSLLVLDHPAVIIAESVATQVYGIAPTVMTMRLGLRLLPRGRQGNSTGPQFSTLLTTIYTSESGDVELDETPVDNHPAGAKVA